MALQELIERAIHHFRHPVLATNLEETRGSSVPAISIRAVVPSGLATVRVGDFEWDEAKARLNFRKHAVAFADADVLACPQRAIGDEAAE